MTTQSRQRQPIISWSSVVLLSTLLLSPMAAATFLHALAKAIPSAFASLDPTATVAAGEDVAVVAPEDAEPVAEKQQIEPETAESRVGAVVVFPVAALLRAYNSPVGNRFAPANFAIRDRILGPTPPRAPPA